MKIKNVLRMTSWMLGAVLIAATGCKKDKSGENEEPTLGGKFFIAASISSAGGSGATGQGTTYALSVDNMEEGETSIIGNGIEIPNTYTHFAYNGTNTVFALLYGQGNSYLATGFELDATSKLKRTGADVVFPNQFATVGAVGNYIVTSRSSRTLSNGKLGAVFYFIDYNNNNATTEKFMETENFQGTGLEAQFVGIEDAGNNEFLTGVTLTNGDPNKVYVAKLDVNLNVKAFYQDDRLSYSAGQRQGARYSQMGNADNGDTYVFSGSYSAATTKHAGALVIKKGANGFDPTYYFDIEAVAGYRFKRVFHLTEDYFFLEFYNTAGAPATAGAASQYAIVRMSTKEFKWISGFPAKEEITATSWPYANPLTGKCYVGVTTANADPVVYVVDPKTFSAKKGMVVRGATGISGLGYLSPQK
ncbi:DUF4374 domain-containing protein [Pedobacter chinensis]|uniref:DUF4374 domain-containing protein n=1 Tax=Pedobacter chinensis TaxID=2282421 RepID=A0A369PVA9_9SPHI|nr:DUF4374 domain-containing protein [Pedobacter chinensis]RDC55175.1 DUF4374 domain-containing protein [Pedobacter chinensis]